MIEFLLQTTIDTVQTEPTWAWLSDWDGEAKWIAVLGIARYGHDVAKDYVAAWRDVSNTRTMHGDPE